MRTTSSGCFFSSRLISIAQSTGASRLLRKTSAPAVAGGQTQKLAFRFSETELLGAANDFPQRLHLLGLLGDEQFGITNDVDEKDVADFQPNFWFYLGGGHLVTSDESIVMQFCRVE